MSHLFSDLLAYGLAILFALFYKKTVFADAEFSVPVTKRYSYFTTLALGSILGAFGFGTLNVWLNSSEWSLGHTLVIGRSILGALVGGIVTVEMYKKAAGWQYSTGAFFVPALALGIAVGRVGCFLAGLNDYTYGVPTSLPWGYDFGDGVLRHPVQLYESLSLFLFLVIYMVSVRSYKQFWLDYGFACFSLYYGLQRFSWEFLKPYPSLIGPLNLFHILSLFLIAYGVWQLRYFFKSSQVNKLSSTMYE